MFGDRFAGWYSERGRFTYPSDLGGAFEHFVAASHNPGAAHKCHRSTDDYNDDEIDEYDEALRDHEQRSMT